MIFQKNSNYNNDKNPSKVWCLVAGGCWVFLWSLETWELPIYTETVLHTGDKHAMTWWLDCLEMLNNFEHKSSLNENEEQGNKSRVAITHVVIGAYLF